MSDRKHHHLLVGSLCALGCEILYGLSYVFTKQATEIASPLALLGWRFLIAIIAMSVGIRVGLVRVSLKGKSIKSLLLIALFSPCIYFIGETVGLSNTTASESGVILACIPVASLLASTVILNEKPSKRQIVGIFITLIGVLITVFSLGTTSSLNVLGYVFLVASVVSYALYSVFVEKASDYTGLEITYIMLLLGAIIFIALAIMEALVNGRVEELISLPFNQGAFMSAVLYQGIGCSIIAVFLSNVAIAKIGVNRTSSYIGVSTIVSIVAGSLLLKESFTLYQLIGVIVIITGVYIANYRQNNVEHSHGTNH
ncbi:DMT family transporter [Aerococcaceae bacterium NML180378]|nr:DMT family transporter [Aerococcaceae bacterium NML180378]